MYPIDVLDRDQFAETVARLVRNELWMATSIATPFKEQVLEVFPDANFGRDVAAAKCANFLYKGLNGLYLENTDGLAALNDITRAFGQTPATAVVVGRGPTGRSVRKTLEAAGASVQVEPQRWLSPQQPERSREVNESDSGYVASSDSSDIDCLVFCVPPLSQHQVRGAVIKAIQELGPTLVYDVNYGIANSWTRQYADSKGANFSDGLGMNTFQAAAAFASWYGRVSPEDLVSDLPPSQ